MLLAYKWRTMHILQKYFWKLYFFHAFNGKQTIFFFLFHWVYNVSNPAEGCHVGVRSVILRPFLTKQWELIVRESGIPVYLSLSSGATDKDHWQQLASYSIVQNWDDITSFLVSADLQGFSHIQAEYQNSVGGSQSPGAPNPVHGQNPDWDSEYCNRDCGPNHCRWAPHISHLIVSW